MGRKIPGRKHHGVKDPEKQRAERLNKIKDKINAPPINPDEQHVPKSLTRLMELKDKVKNGLSGKKMKIDKERVVKALRTKTKPGKNNNKNFTKPIEKPVPKFERREGENDRTFVNRINRICQNVQREAAFENKYGVDIKRNPETGRVEEVVKRPKDELQILINKAKKEKKDKGKKKKKKNENKEPKLTKSQKWQLKKNEKKKKKLAESQHLDFDSYKDQVKFGEIVHAPPTLAAPKRVEKLINAPRPGNKQLLLKSLLNSSEDKKQNKENSVNVSEASLRKTKNKVIDRKGKRKDLPQGVRRQLDRQQKEIIEAYKLLKAKKQTN